MELIVHKPQRILFATDLSETDRYALDFAAMQAGLFGAGIVILHVKSEMERTVEDTVRRFLGEEGFRSWKQAQEATLERMLEEDRNEAYYVEQAIGNMLDGAGAAGGLPGPFNIEVVTRKGRVVENILEVVKEKGCDLIVLGYHRLSLFYELFVGNVPKTLIEKSQVPVLVVPEPKRAAK
jgi:nucleotide-binding universal stress UspA family protein